MKRCAILCISFLIATSSIASAQIAVQCASDALPAAAAQGRNAWAASCGYISAAARDFYNTDGDYVVFTSGCGRTGCNPVIPVTATAGCISGLVALGLCRNAFTIGLGSLESGITVTSSRGVENCDSGSCDLAFAGGSSLTVHLTSTSNTADCLMFSSWLGACAGQGATCSLVINSNLSASARWTRISNCVPR
jgi:hypothetical protein